MTTPAPAAFIRARLFSVSEAESSLPELPSLSPPLSCMDRHFWDSQATALPLFFSFRSLLRPFYWHVLGLCALPLTESGNCVAMGY